MMKNVVHVKKDLIPYINMMILERQWLMKDAISLPAEDMLIILMEQLKNAKLPI